MRSLRKKIDRKKRWLLFWVFMILLPLVGHAQSIKSIFWGMTGVITVFLVPFLMTLTVAVFIIGVVRFIAASGDVEKRKKSKEFIIWGLVVLFFLVCFWAVIQVIMNTFFGGAPEAPSIWPPEIF